MSRALNKELERIHGRLTECLKEPLLTPHTRACIFLTALWLHVLADRETKAPDPQERRQITGEFERVKRALEAAVPVILGQAGQ